MRYYRNTWVPENPHSGSGGNIPLALLATALIAVIAGLAVYAFPAFDTRAVEEATVYVEVDRDGDGTFDSSGSGFLISPDGNVVTNRHVVFPKGAQGTKIRVSLYSGTPRRVQFPAEVKDSDRSDVNLDPKNPKTLWHDWAVLKINPQTANLPFLRIGESRQAGRGTAVIAAGFPLGPTTATSSNGPSAKADRGSITRPDPDEQGGIIRLTHNCQLTHGHSGGPLCNARGEVIGINSQILIAPEGGNSGENYAIPAHMLTDQVWKLYARPGSATQ